MRRIPPAVWLLLGLLFAAALAAAMLAAARAAAELVGPNSVTVHLIELSVLSP